MAQRTGYNEVSVTGAKERCSNCELLNILGKPKYGQKRCKDCIEKENKRKMKQKHIPVHLRKRTLAEQTEKANRILAEETANAEEANEADEDLLGAPKNADEEEQVRLSDILEITFELLDLVETHVSRSGNLEEIARFENQLKILRQGRDSAKSQAHLEDKRAIILAFSIFTEHYTLLIRDYEKLSKKNQALKQLAYDTAGLVKKNEAQFESYVSELKSLQGQNMNVNQQSKIELTKLRNEITGLKLELNLRTNELREMQLESNANQEQMRRERERADEMRKDKDSRITSLLAQLQQFSLDYAHEKSERLRLERENERLWTDRMAYRQEQIRSKSLSAQERTLAAERDATEKREWLEWKKKAALRDVANKERLRSEAWEIRRNVEAEAQAEMEKIRRDLGTGSSISAAEEARPSTLYGRTKEQRAAEREATRRANAKAERERDWWMENEERPSSGSNIPIPPTATGFPSDLSQISSASQAGKNAQRWGARMARQAEEEEIDRQIEELKKRNTAIQMRSNTQPSLSQYEPNLNSNDVIRSGNYTGGVEAVFNNPRTSPSLPYFSDTPSNTLTWQNPPSLQPNSRPANNYTSTNLHPSAVAYQPTSVAASIPPPINSTNQSGPSMEDQIREVQRQIEEMQAQNDRKSATVVSAAANVTTAPAVVGSSSYPSQQSQPLSYPSSSSTLRPTGPSSASADYDAIEEGLRRSRQIRNESARVARAAPTATSSLPLTASPTQPATVSTTSTRTSVTSSKHHRTGTGSSSSNGSSSARSRDSDVKVDRPSSRSRVAVERTRVSSESPERSRSVSLEREHERERAREKKSSTKEKKQKSKKRERREEEQPISSEEEQQPEAGDDDEEEVDRSRSVSPRERVHDQTGRHRTSRGHSSSSNTGSKIVDGREAVPVRNLTLYAFKSLNNMKLNHPPSPSA